jgi:hypothetical protein
MNVNLVPPTPKLNEKGKSSGWISVTWTINEITNIQSFDIYRNGSIIANLNKLNFSSSDTIFSYNYTNLEPFHE